MTPTFWMASDEWPEFWDPVGATVVGRMAAPDGWTVSGELVVVRLDGDDRLRVVADNPPAPGRPTSARVFSGPPGWDGERPLGAPELTFAAEPLLYASRDEAPVVPDERRERNRKGWAF